MNIERPRPRRERRPDGWRRKTPTRVFGDEVGNTGAADSRSAAKEKKPL
jgi:hypothetical protein